jgi:hypothetical protein
LGHSFNRWLALLKRRASLEVSSIMANPTWSAAVFYQQWDGFQGLPSFVLALDGF